MKNTKFSVSLTIIFCALLMQVQKARGQDVPPPDTTWEADPLDVLEPKKEAPAEPAVPEFKEITPEHHNVETPAPPSAPEADVPAPKTQHAESSFSGGGDEGPDFNRETYFHNIYKKYNLTPTSDEAWEKAVGARKAEVYKVQKGNTLWDISNTFFGDPNFWPKIWSLNNGEILNPHEITPDMNIKFYPGTMMDAPTVGLAKAEGAAESDKVVEPSVAEPPAPPSRRKHTAVLKKLPGSLPYGRFGIYDNSTGIDIQFRKNQYPVPFEYLSYYLSDTPIVGSGVITGTELDAQTANEYQYVYVQINGATEKNYIVQRNMGDIKDPSSGRKAEMVEIQGALELMEKVNAEKNIYRALVKKAIQPIEVGSSIVAGTLPMIDPRPGAVAEGASGKIMGGQYGKKRDLFSANSLVFLDGGASRGFQEGQNLTIFADETLRNKNSSAVINDRAIGTIKVVKVSPNFTTAYVTKSKEDILLGDYVGLGKKAAATTAPAPQPAQPEGGSEDLDLEL